MIALQEEQRSVTKKGGTMRIDANDVDHFAFVGGASRTITMTSPAGPMFFCAPA